MHLLLRLLSIFETLLKEEEEEKEDDDEKNHLYAHRGHLFAMCRFRIYIFEIRSNAVERLLSL